MRSASIARILAALFGIVLTGWIASVGVKAQPVPGAPKSAPSPRAESRRSIREILSRKIELKGVPEGTTIREALSQLRDEFGLAFIINVRAFKDDRQINDPEIQPVKLAKMPGVRLDTVLGLLAKQVEGTYMLRSDHVEITTAEKRAEEVWGTVDEPEPRAPTYQGKIEERGKATGWGMGWILQPPVRPRVAAVRQRPRLTPVSLAFERRPVDQALRELAEAAAVSIILDEGRAAAQAKTPISATLNNVPLDTAVRIVANQAELKAVLLDNALYVTTEANADAMEAEQQRVNRHGLDPGVPPGLP